MMSKYNCRPFYETVEDTYAEPVSDCELYRYLEPIGNTFSSIYVPYEKLEATGEVRKSYINIGLSLTDIVTDFYAAYSNRFIGFSIKDDIDAQRAVTRYRIKACVQGIMDRNKYKYLKLIETLGYTYDPIANYDMNETSGTWNNDGGMTQTTTPTGKTKVTSTPSGSYENEHYKTQYDDTGKTDANLESYDKTLYNGNYKEENVTEYLDNANVKVVTEHDGINKEISAENDIYNIGSGELDSFSGSKLRRYGNIGVTTSQQMIESQRKLVRFNIIQELFNDLEKEILLNVYNN